MQNDAPKGKVEFDRSSSCSLFGSKKKEKIINPYTEFMDEYEFESNTSIHPSM